MAPSLRTAAVALTVAAVVVAVGDVAAAGVAKLHRPAVAKAGQAVAKAGQAAAAKHATPDTPFEEFKRLFKRRYAHAAEEAERKAHYERNMRDAKALQARNPLAAFGPNEYADWSPLELRSLRGLRANATAAFAEGHARQAARVRAGKQTLRAPKGTAPSAINWVDQGVVTGVKNQGQCGDCWSFSTTGNIEGQWAIAGNSLVSLSEQELTSCDTTDSGCNGGLPWDAMAWLINNQGGYITAEADYPFVSGSGSDPACAFSSASMPGAAQISSYQQLTAGDESNLQQFVGQYGPMSIAVDATSWQTYQGGILTSCQAQAIDHAVLAVGYDLTASTPYWIVKNSWGASWGESGYIRVAYGGNLCLIANAPSTATAA